MKRILILTLCAALLVSLIPAVALPASAAVEGDWTTYRFANDYPQPEDDPEDEYIYRPAPGYKYTSEGFTVIPADYTDTTPQMTVQTKEAQEIKDGLYLRFRIDDFSYDNGTAADEWIAITLTDREKVAPGSTFYGGGWLALVRGSGDGDCTILPHLTDPATDSFGGTFKNVGMKNGSAELDNLGREIYTLEITWNGSAYEMKLNGTVIPGAADTTALLEKLSPSGEFYVGISLHAGVKNGTAALTILEYGTTKANATVPVGDDTKYPEENICGTAAIADPSTVPANQPAILWSPETVGNMKGHNCTFRVLNDNTWRISATDAAVYFSFAPKRQWSYAAEDFPVFGILLRNFWGDNGTLWFSAGELMGPANDSLIPFSVYDGEFYGEEGEYVFIPVDLSDLWEGRINNFRVDFMMYDESTWTFDLCFAGVFRSTDEAYAYAEDYLRYCDGFDPEPTPTEPTTEPPTEPPTEPVTEPVTEPATEPVTEPVIELPTEPATESPTETPIEPPVEPDPDFWETLPDEVITEIVSDVEYILDTEEGETIDVEEAVDDILKKYGCAGSVGMLAILMPLLAAYALKKKP